MAGQMADTGGKRYGDGCAGRERGGATTARAVCTEVLSMVHHSLVCIARNSHCALVAEAMNVLGRYLFHKIDIAILNDDAVVGVVDWAS